MKTGKVAKAFGIDRKTVSNWTDMDQLKRFFTDEALGIGRSQRNYLEPDLLVINTIRVMRAESRDWDDIAASLERGERETELPASAMLVETTAPIAQYGRIVELQTALEAAEEQTVLMQERIKELNQNMIEREQSHQERIERILREATDREGKLQREIGKLEAMIEMVQQENDDKNNNL
jgi:DNA-binding transcriptional MerR regulator